MMETPNSQTKGEKADKTDAKIQCKICLEHFAAEDAEKRICGDQCEVVCCSKCLGTYFENIVQSGFDGACPKMKCPLCRFRTVPISVWGKYVSNETTETFIKRATILLSLQCASCHTRKSLMVFPTDSYDGAKFQSLLQELGEEACVQYRKSLAEYLSAELHESSFFKMISTVFFKEVFDNGDTVWADVMLPLLVSIPDEERRASLHLRFLRSFPKVTTKCCGSIQCFRCRTARWHENKSCEEVQAEHYKSDDLITCEACDIQLVKGDGCSSVTCVCGHNFDWSARLKVVLSTRFEQIHGEESSYLAALMQYRSSSFDEEQIQMAKHWSTQNPTLAEQGKADLWTEIHGPHVAYATFSVLKNSKIESDRSMATSWKNFNGEEYKQAQDKYNDLCKKIWSNLFERGLPGIEVTGNFLANRYFISRGARVRSTQFMNSTQIGLCPNGTFIKIAEEYVLPCGKVRVRIIEPKEWIGWATKASHIIEEVKQSNHFALPNFPLQHWMEENPSSIQKAKTMKLISSTRAWRFLYGSQCNEVADRVLADEIVIPDQHQQYLRAFTLSNRHKICSDIQNVYQFKQQNGSCHESALAMAIEIEDSLNTKKLVGAKRYLNAQRYAAKRYRARSWGKKWKTLVAGVTSSILQSNGQSEIDTRYANDWASLNKTKLLAADQEVYQANQNIVQTFFPESSNITSLVCRHPLIVNPLSAIVTSSATKEHILANCTAKERVRKDAMSFQALYGHCSATRQVASSHLALYDAWKSTLVSSNGKRILKLLHLGVPVTTIEGALHLLKPGSFDGGISFSSLEQEHPLLSNLVDFAHPCSKEIAPPLEPETICGVDTSELNHMLKRRLSSAGN